MYLVGKGHDHMGPGTSMVQRIEWSRANEVQMMKAMKGIGPGLGCVGLGCTGLVPEFASDCRQMERYKGMGCACERMPYCGLGLFDSMDPNTWTWQEWAVVAVGVYAGLSLLGDTKRGAARVRRVSTAVRKAA